MQESELCFTACPSITGDCHEPFTTSELLENQDLVSFYLTGVQTCELGGIANNHQTRATPLQNILSNIANSNNPTHLEAPGLSFVIDSEQKMFSEPSFMLEQGTSTMRYGSPLTPADEFATSGTSGETLLPSAVANTDFWLASYDDAYDHLSFGQNISIDNVDHGVYADTGKYCCNAFDSSYGNYLSPNARCHNVLDFDAMLPPRQQDEEERENKSPTFSHSDITSFVCKREEVGTTPYTSDTFEGLNKQRPIWTFMPVFKADAEATALAKQAEIEDSNLLSHTVLPRSQYDSRISIGGHGAHEASQYESVYPPLPPFVPDFDMEPYHFGSCFEFNDFPVVQHGLLPVSLPDSKYNPEHTAILRGGYVPRGPYQVAASNVFQNSRDRRESALRDTSKDDYLLDCRRQGLSYKEIKAKGGFEEAESTLRGRVRALTKPKAARVRKPDWTEGDVAILKQTVERFLRASIGGSPAGSVSSHRHGARAQRHALNRIPWKQVAENMANRGCYHFGNATVKKKYMEIMGYRNVTCDWS